MKSVEIGDRYRRALHCRICFKEHTGLRAPIIDLAQPRWIGSRYFEVKPRLAFVMLNPGAGDPSKEASNRTARELLVMFRDGRKTFSEVLTFQRQHMESWGKPAGRFLRFYTQGLGLKLDDLAFLNIALCATEGNKYPPWMLRRCFADHTSRILRELNPDLVVLCGGNAKRFDKVIASLCPGARIVSMLHHAHRKGQSIKAKEQALLRKVIDDLAHSSL